jgi:RNA polymerase sigma-70 factor (ECF subfamily)
MLQKKETEVGEAPDAPPPAVTPGFTESGVRPVAASEAGGGTATAMVLAVYLSIRAPVRRMLIRKGVHPQDADDVVQTLMMRFLEVAFARGASIEDPEAYVWTMAWKALEPYIEEQHKHPVAEKEGEDQAAPSSRTSSLRVCVRTERVQRLRLALAKLPQKTTKIIWLVEVDDLTYVDIGKMLGLTAAAVRSQYRHGIEALEKSVNPRNETYDAGGGT